MAMSRHWSVKLPFPIALIGCHDIALKSRHCSADVATLSCDVATLNFLILLTTANVVAMSWLCPDIGCLM